MKTIFLIIILFSATFDIFAQTASKEIAFIADIQSPLWVEMFLLKRYRNEEASDTLISDILKRKPGALFMLGDVLSIGSAANQWTQIDQKLHQLRKNKIPVFAVPGNHEYEFVSQYGIANFIKSFPDCPIDGFFKVIDSVAIIMLNSNFSQLWPEQKMTQIDFYQKTIDSLDKSAGVKFIIIACHHPPYTNSTIVNSDKEVQKYFTPLFEKANKAVLFLSGHSHNLEYFVNHKKNYLVIGGGGGLKQPLFEKGKRQYKDEIDNEFKPLYFYIILKRNGNELSVISRGLNRNFVFFECNLMTIPSFDNLARISNN